MSEADEIRPTPKDFAPPFIYETDETTGRRFVIWTDKADCAGETITLQWGFVRPDDDSEYEKLRDALREVAWQQLELCRLGLLDEVRAASSTVFSAG